MKIRVKVKPNARTNEVKKLDENYYEVRVTVPTEKGKANKKVIEVLSEYLRLPKSKIAIKSGEKSREKVIEIV
jgi:uncharacterized protein (TIGR00251 family)